MRICRRYPNYSNAKQNALLFVLSVQFSRFQSPILHENYASSNLFASFNKLFSSFLNTLCLLVVDYFFKRTKTCHANFRCISHIYIYIYIYIYIERERDSEREREHKRNKV